MTDNKQNKVVPQIADVSLLPKSEVDCVMNFGGSRYVCWGFFKVAPDFSLDLTHLSMNKMGAKGINHVSKIETFSPFIVKAVRDALEQKIDADFFESYKEAQGAITRD